MEASVLVFKAVDLDSCTTMVRQFFHENKSANTVKIALSTHDLKPLASVASCSRQH
jgi:hypothetical protein